MTDEQARFLYNFFDQVDLALGRGGLTLAVIKRELDDEFFSVPTLEGIFEAYVQGVDREALLRRIQFVHEKYWREKKKGGAK